MVTVTEREAVAPEIGLPMKGRIHGSDSGTTGEARDLARMRERYDGAKGKRAEGKRCHR